MLLRYSNTGYKASCTSDEDGNEATTEIRELITLGSRTKAQPKMVAKNGSTCASTMPNTPSTSWASDLGRHSDGGRTTTLPALTAGSLIKPRHSLLKSN